MTQFVVDSNIVTKWVITEDDTPMAILLRSANNGFHAPAPLWSECANIFWKKQRRNEISAAEAALSAAIVERVNVTLHVTVPLLRRVVELATLFDYSAYDCEYLALAEHLAMPFVTADAKLVKKVVERSYEGCPVVALTDAPNL